MKKYLSILGLESNRQYTIAELKEARNKKVQTAHPDKGGSDEEFRKVMHAYNMLSDPSYRAENEQNGELRKMDLNIRMQVPISFEQAFVGCTFNLNFNKVEIDETGKQVPKEVHDIETLVVTVVKGSMHGFVTNFKKLGITRGEEVGDVEVNVVVEQHPKFRSDERGNIIVAEKIPLDLLLKGGRMDVQTMFGIRVMKLNPGTRPGEKIALKGLGANGMDHIIICDPLFPTQDELKSEAWKGLDVNWEVDEEVKKEQKEEDELQRLFRRTKTGIYVSNFGM